MQFQTIKTGFSAGAWAPTSAFSGDTEVTFTALAGDVLVGGSTFTTAAKGSISNVGAYLLEEGKTMTMRFGDGDRFYIAAAVDSGGPDSLLAWFASSN